MKSNKQLFRNNFFFDIKSARLIYNNEGEKRTPEASNKSPEADKTKPEKKAETVTVKDLQEEKQKAIQKIQATIKHPEIQKIALSNLETKTGPISQRLANLETARQTTKEQIRAELSQLITEILSQPDVQNFNYININGTRFDYDPPLSQDRYPQELEKATASLKLAEAYKKQSPDYNTFSSKFFVYKNSEITISLSRDNKDNPQDPNKELRFVKILGNTINEENSDQKKEQRINNAQAFSNAFNEWRNNGNAQSFTYGEPPKTFPPEGFNLKEYLENIGRNKADLTIAMLQRTPGTGVSSLDETRTSVTTTIEWKNGEAKAVSTREEKKFVLSGKGEAVEKDKDGRVLREEKTEEQIVNRQKRLVTTVSEYWPQDSGHPLLIKRQETYKDGVISSRTEYSKDGKMQKRETYVQDCEGVVGVDTPTGKMVPEVDEEGNPVKDQYGEVKLVPEVKRAMEFTDQHGRKVIIRTLSEVNEERKKAKQSPMTPEEYMNFLATSLQSDQQKKAFSNLMMHYRADDKGTDNWQTGEQTIQREYNGVFIGDCEDYAHFWENINSLQGRQSYVLGLPNHAENITFVRNTNNKITVIRAGTFGYHTEQEEFDTTEQALNYLTNNVYKTSISNVEELGNGRFFEPPKNGEKPKVTILRLDRSKTDKDRQTTQETATNELKINPAPQPQQIATGPNQHPTGG